MRNKNISILLCCLYFITWSTQTFCIPLNRFKLDTLPDSKLDSLLHPAVNGMSLRDPPSITKQFGEKIEKRTQNDDISEIGLPYAVVLNKSKNKYLLMVSKEYDSCCWYFEVGINKRKYRSSEAIFSSFDDFAADNGIGIGLELDSFIKIFSGINFSIEKSSDTIFYRYLILNPERTEYFKKNYYKYVSEYVFVKNRLIRFGYGQLFSLPYWWFGSRVGEPLKKKYLSPRIKTRLNHKIKKKWVTNY